MVLKKHLINHTSQNKGEAYCSSNAKIVLDDLEGVDCQTCINIFTNPFGNAQSYTIPEINTIKIFTEFKAKDKKIQLKNARIYRNIMQYVVSVLENYFSIPIISDMRYIMTFDTRKIVGMSVQYKVMDAIVKYYCENYTLIPNRQEVFSIINALVLFDREILDGIIE